MYSYKNNVVSFAEAQARQKGFFDAPSGEVKIPAQWQGQNRTTIQIAALRRILGTPADAHYVTAAQLQTHLNVSAASLRKIPISKLLRFSDRKHGNGVYYLIADLARYLTHNPGCRTLKVGMFNPNHA